MAPGDNQSAAGQFPLFQEPQHSPCTYEPQPIPYNSDFNQFTTP